MEKYKPHSIDEIIGHDNNIKILKDQFSNKSFSHILFHGASGTGKASTISSLIDYIWKF